MIISEVLDSLKDLYLPQTCAACLTQFGEDGHDGMCGNCLKRLELFEVALCKRCSRPSGTDICLSCRRDPPKANRIIALGWYQGIFAEMIRGAKIWGIHECLSYLYDRIKSELEPEYDAIVAIPSNHKLVKILSNEIANMLDAEFLELVRRKKEAIEQVGLTKKERKENAKKSFELTSKKIPQSILVIDDISTTGATLDAVCSLLKDNGAIKVDAFVLAIVPE